LSCSEPGRLARRQISVRRRALVEQRQNPVNDVLIHLQSALAIGDLPGNERYNNVFFQLSFSCSDLGALQ
jgi:hypothetical protein